MGTRWVAGALMMAWTGCTSVAAPGPELPSPYEQDGIHVHLDGHVRQVYGGGITAISGVAENRSDRDMATVVITLSLVDADGAKVADAIATTQQLRRGQTWKFQATVMGQHTRVPFQKVVPGKVTLIPER